MCYEDCIKALALPTQPTNEEVIEAYAQWARRLIPYTLSYPDDSKPVSLLNAVKNVLLRQDTKQDNMLLEHMDANQVTAIWRTAEHMGRVGLRENNRDISEISRICGISEDAEAEQAPFREGDDKAIAAVAAWQREYEQERQRNIPIETGVFKKILISVIGVVLLILMALVVGKISGR